MKNPHIPFDYTTTANDANVCSVPQESCFIKGMWKSPAVVSNFAQFGALGVTHNKLNDSH